MKENIRKNDASEPLLHVGHVPYVSTGPNTPLEPKSYGRSPTFGQSEEDIFTGRSPKRMREKYLKQLGYTPLIFQVRIGNFCMIGAHDVTCCKQCRK
jgi:hypothetical protein